MKCLFQLLEEKLSPLLQSQTQCPDQLLLQWLVLLFSHLLSSLSQPKQVQNQSNLFAPVLNLPLGKPRQGEGEGEEKRGAVVDIVAELGERRREMKRRLAELQHKMKILVGEEKLALRHEYETIIQVCVCVCVCVCVYTSHNITCGDACISSTLHPFTLHPPPSTPSPSTPSPSTIHCSPPTHALLLHPPRITVLSGNTNSREPEKWQPTESQTPFLLLTLGHWNRTQCSPPSPCSSVSM